MRGVSHHLYLALLVVLQALVTENVAASRDKNPFRDVHLP